MKRIAALVIALLLSLPLHADDTPLVVVSARQYLVKGDSTIHLYLYSLGGKLIKQLTSDPGQDDHAPMFSRDGKTVLFSRVTTGEGLPKQTGKYILDLANGKVTPVPDGSPADIAVRGFNPTVETVPFDDLAFIDNMPGEPYPAEGKNATSLTAPDKSATLISIASGNDDVPSTYKLKTDSAAKAEPISQFSGYQPVPENIFGELFIASKEGPFLIGPNHYGALFTNRHTDSMWVFDLRRKTWHKMETLWSVGDIYVPKDKAGFYFVSCGMEPLGDTGKTVLSAYLEWWDATFKPVVLGPKLSVTYGAATWYGNGETSTLVDEQHGS